MKPLVSILIPAFNAEAWIADTIKSALAQTWPRKEIIVVVDDGCTDRTLSAARSVDSQEISVFTRPHQSAAGGRNDAFSLSKGDFIQWLDADDLLAPDKIAKQMEEVERFQNKRLLLSCAWGDFMYRVSRARFSPTRLWCDLSPDEWLLRKMGENLHMQPGTWLISRELTEAIGPWDVRLIDEDGEYFCRLVLASEGIRFVPGARVFYRKSGFSSYTRRSSSDTEGRWLTVQMQLSHLRLLGDTQRVRTACLNYLQGYLIYFYPERPDVVRQLEDLATTLGGKLEMPRLRWKYAWIARLFGYRLAKRTQFLLPGLRWSLMRSMDKALLPFERHRHLQELRKP